MSKIIYSIAIVTVVLSLGLQTSFAKSSKERTAKEAAQVAAKQWLALVDAGDYDASWDQASSFFKSQRGKDLWRRQVSKARAPIGRLKPRKVARSQYATELPNAPDGEYVIFQYVAAYEKKAKAVETITPMLDTDGKWRVSGYYIR